ncbi:hypothetical protein DSO57_1008137 [Entomophthora muscae]|uniref:Uncharacterized protein n=1 Tax=Entomophthora muscae TaxID=34485 RepID=A0ACC2SJX4_9FUNG|nr:hypothetical protein DSO57_1008137 [Entomophthora muscae]
MAFQLGKIIPGIMESTVTVTFYASDSDKSIKDSLLPHSHPFALSASSQSTNPASPTPPSRPSHPPSNPDSQTTTHSLPTTSDAVPFTGADEGGVHSAHSLPYSSFDE